MMSFWSNAMGSAGGGGGGGGGVCFNSTIQVVNADNTISIRHMNPHGGYYDTEMVETYDEDDGSLSFHLDSSQTNEDGLSFLDAVQDLVVSADSSASCPTTTTSNNDGFNDDDHDDNDNDDDSPVNDYFQSSGYEPKPCCCCARARARQLRMRCVVGAPEHGAFWRPADRITRLTHVSDFVPIVCLFANTHCACLLLYYCTLYGHAAK
jgi:hypothetical protein